MASRRERLAAVVCHDRPAMRAPVVRLLEECGFHVCAVVASFGDVTALATEHAPCVAVVALPSTGMSGLLAVSALREAVPRCEIVLLHPSGGLESAAVAAGARALVPEDDLRGLRLSLLELSGAPLGVHVPRGGRSSVGRGQRQSEDEAVVVAQLAVHRPGERASDGQAQPASSATVQADKAAEHALTRVV